MIERAFFYRLALVSVVSILGLSGCNTDPLPQTPKTDFRVPKPTDEKFPVINESAPITYVKLDKDVLRPTVQSDGHLPFTDFVGPFEMREETLAGALQLILSDRKVPLAFQTSKATTNTLTISNLQGPMNEVVDRACSLANLYCSYEDGTLMVKEMESFTVSLPPMIADDYSPFVNGLQALTGGQTYVDSLTRSLTYTTSQRSHQRAIEYFDRLRANTALIIYEVQIWEVQLNDQNQTGINWKTFDATVGNIGLNAVQSGAATIAGSLGIGAQYKTGKLTTSAILSFLQTQGAVRTVSQPQLSVLSGSSAKLRIGNKRDYVSQITRTVGISTSDNVSVATSKLETGLNLEINSAWDQGTVYGNLKIDLQDLINLDSLEVGTTSIQLPETSDRSIETRLRVRPGDAVIIGGILEQRDNLNQSGIPGKENPLFALNKDRQARRTELVFMLRPRVIVYTEKLPTEAQLQDAATVTEPVRNSSDALMLIRPEDRPVGQLPTSPVPVVK